MVVAYQQSLSITVSGGSSMASLCLCLLSLSIQFSFLAYLYFALLRPKTISLLTNGIHSIQRGIPHQLSIEISTPATVLTHWSQGLQFYELVDVTENKIAHGITRRVEVLRTKNYNHHPKRKQKRQGLNSAVRERLRKKDHEFQDLNVVASRPAWAP